ncbi:hypothetical protein BE20_23490 [Sorangium cellulosum]|nr:hypothetical protein BE20_23490 [Sorangium cellulosum]
MISPVTAVFAAEHRKTMVGATSSGRNSRPTGYAFPRCAITSGDITPIILSVTVKPGPWSADLAAA